jgi:hypothetical protein
VGVPRELRPRSMTVIAQDRAHARPTPARISSRAAATSSRSRSSTAASRLVSPKTDQAQWPATASRTAPSVWRALELAAAAGVTTRTSAPREPHRARVLVLEVGDRAPEIRCARRDGRVTFRRVRRRCVMETLRWREIGVYSRCAKRLTWGGHEECWGRDHRGRRRMPRRV